MFTQCNDCLDRRPQFIDDTDVEIGGLDLDDDVDSDNLIEPPEIDVL